MPKAVSASEAKNNLGSILDWAVENRDEVIVERQGRPRAVIMAFAEYETVQALREEARRRAALERLRRVRDRVRARNDDLSEVVATELADRFVRETVDELAAEGRIRFERDE